MPKNNESKDFSKCFVLPNPGLRSYFDIVRRGNPDEYRTTFARGESLKKVLQDWSHVLDQLTDKWPTLVDFENDLRSKVGPMSIMKPLSERIPDIDHYYEDILRPSEPIHHSAIMAVLDEFSNCKGLRVRNQRATVDNMKKSTNSGSPYFTKRRAVVDKTIPCRTWMRDNADIENEPIALQELGDKQYNACAVLGWRGQEGGPNDDDVKQRVVWMFPFAVNIRELQVYQPLIEKCQHYDLVPAWVSMESVDFRITRMFDTKPKEDVVICTDFTKFDQHFNGHMQDCAMYILGHLLDRSVSGRKDTIRWLNDVFPIKYEIPLAYDYGKIRYGKHGMGSGSGGTNADETLVHRALLYESAIQSGVKLNPHSQCLGDDGVLTFPGITVENVIDTYQKHGQEMNESKQYVSKSDCIYLRRWHHIDYRVNGICVGVYSTYRALGRLMEQERFYDPEVWSSKMVALRQLSIIENTKYHPLFEQFVDFCMKRDKYRLGIDIPGFLENIDEIAARAIDLMPDFLGYTKTMQAVQPGLSGWRVVKYLKSKR